jgi:serine/threonine protein kinase
MKKHISVRDDTRNCLKVDAYYKVKGFIPDSVLRPFSVDLWSAGVVLFAMLYGTVPFKANNMEELHKLIVNYFQKSLQKIQYRTCH